MDFAQNKEKYTSSFSSFFMAEIFKNYTMLFNVLRSKKKKEEKCYFL